jgi:hypothetical protein
MLSVKELRSFAKKLDASLFREQLGPFALVQRPPGEPLLPLSQAMNRTIPSARSTSQQPSLLFELDNLIVATLPPIETASELTVGRQPGCELMIDDPSVSRRHATIKWDKSSRRASLEDLKSSNGTSVNGTPVRRAVWLLDGDDVSFGDTRFCFLLADSLFKTLNSKR